MPKKHEAQMKREESCKTVRNTTFVKGVMDILTMLKV
jgi:hypothetical protein